MPFNECSESPTRSPDWSTSSLSDPQNDSNQIEFDGCSSFSPVEDFSSSSIGKSENFFSFQTEDILNQKLKTFSDILDEDFLICENQETVMNIKKLNKSGTKCDVFLGGSCNPTKWRQNMAVPFFEERGIKPYNPQVSHWTPDLVQIENQAKKNAKVMLFIIDSRTRGVVTMIEAAHDAGAERKLIVAFVEFSGPRTAALEDPYTEKEQLDLRRAQRYLRELLSCKGVSVFESIQEALLATARILQEGPQDLQVLQDKRLDAERLDREMRSIFNAVDVDKKGLLSIDDVHLASSFVTSREAEMTYLRSIIVERNRKLNLTSETNGIRVCFEQFCRMLNFSFSNNKNNFIHNRNNNNDETLEYLINGYNVDQPFSIADVPDTNTRCQCQEDRFQCYRWNVFLGVSGGPDNWWTEVAIPILKKRGLRYLCQRHCTRCRELPVTETTSGIDDCSVLLFVITNRTRAHDQMILASHYIGRKRKVVLCIQYLEDGVIVDGEKLSEIAVKDYNRGRVYLSDFAQSAGVDVFQDLEEAVDCVVNSSRSSLS